MYYNRDIYDSGINQTPIYFKEGNLEMVCMNFLRMFFSENENNKDWLYEVKKPDFEEFDTSRLLEEDDNVDDPKRNSSNHLKNIVKKIM